MKVDGVLRDDGTILALEIEARDDSRRVAAVTRINGIFEGVDDDGNWLISGTKITVGPGADTDGLPSLGQRVKVKALVQPEGSLLAREIENVRGSSVDRGDSRQVKIEGILQEIDSDGSWIVNGTKVSLGPDTRLKGTPAVGQLVEVKGRRQDDGSILATKIEGEGTEISRHKSRVELEGVIQEILDDGTLVINGHHVRIGDLTELDGDPVEGDYVEVEAFLADDGTLIAREVESKGSLEAGEIPDLSEVKIEGTIDRINDDGTLVVNGITVATTTLSEIRGAVTVGASVKIEGVLQVDGTLLASEIKGEGRRATSSGSEVKIDGLVGAVNRDANGRVVSIVVDGLTVAVEALTRFEGSVREGVSVEVKGIVVDGVLLGGKIEARRARGDDQGRDRSPSALKFEGVIESIATSTAGIVGIRLHGVNVVIETDTIVETELSVGDVVEVKAISIDGAIVAIKVESKVSLHARPARSAFKLTGVVGSVDRDASGHIVRVVVDGRTIEVQALTRVKGLVDVGIEVHVQGAVIGDTLVARTIEGGDEGRGGQGRAPGQDGRGGLEFRGIVAAITSDATTTILVLEDGSSFLVQAGTEIEGELAVGTQVRVRAEFIDGVSVATGVRVEGPRRNGTSQGRGGRDNGPGAAGLEGRVEREISGVIASITAGATSITVTLEDGTSFVVRPNTETEGELSVGAAVRARAVEADGVTVAVKVEVEGSGGQRTERDGGGGGGEDGRDGLELSGIIASIDIGADSTTVTLEDGASFVVRPNTETEGELSVGAAVRVRAVETDGVTVAVKVEVEGSGGQRTERDEGGGSGADGRDGLQLSGIIASIDIGADSTTVTLDDGTSFVVRPNTEIEGELAVGARVRVRAVEADGVTLAVKVEVEGSGGQRTVRDEGEANGEDGRDGLELSGIIASIDIGADSTTVTLEDGTSFVVRPNTEIEGEFAVGARVRVRAVETDGVRVATEVKVD